MRHRQHRSLCRGEASARLRAAVARARPSRLWLPMTAGLALLLGACATSTPYQPVSASNRVSGGYSEVRLEEARYRVTFSGNMFTTRDKVEGYLLYRAAELTVQQGYDWFVIVERETEHRVERRLEPDPLYTPWYGPGYGYWQPNWRFYLGNGWHYWYPGDGDPFWANHVDTRTVEQFEATAEIKMRRGQAPENRRRAFDAHEVLQRLGPTIERPQP